MNGKRPGEADSGIAAALAQDGPVLVDAVVNCTELAMRPSITAEMAKRFTLYGRGARHEPILRQGRESSATPAQDTLLHSSDTLPSHGRGDHI
jgi:hypothetical protein